MKEQAIEQANLIVPQVTEFLEAATARRFLYRSWVETKAIRAYLRKSQRLLDGVARQCLDIASVEIADEYQQQGLFTAFVLQAHELHMWEATYIEHAYNSIIAHWCRKRGWKCDPGSDPLSFYLLKETAQDVT